ncbi:methyltransferase domain-containing protein [Confluentibacter flavum]|uniref:Methyltransferase n=1 Tax=Confluentibacter flavum TaxID=1909700 RepID=A0A2N3HEX2_9FLAO|nr:methyltransferase [Confluentibacter flavum]PKQ43531.1 methyltransferase [Confluentibacter flavum]
MYQNSYPDKRYKHTINFLKKYISNTETILDLGVENPFTKVMQEHGYKVSNTLGEDLDIDTSAIKYSEAQVVTAFEIFEHLLSPFTVLKSIPTDKLVASVPLKLWFSPAYRSKTDMLDRHYHEFEDWQFDWLLEKTGWKIIATEKWTNPTKKLGLRPILRFFTPRYYIVYAEKIKH